MRILLVTGRPADFADFTNALGQRGATVDIAATAATAQSMAKIVPPRLCVVDDALPDATSFALVAGLMRQNAMIDTAVVSTLSPEDFHEAGEGLGILTALPRRPGPAEAASLLATLAAMG